MEKNLNRVFHFVVEYKLFSLAIVASLISLVLQLTSYTTAAHWLLGAVALFEVIPLLWDMWQDIQGGRYGIDILAATAIVASVLLKQYWAAMVVVVMLTGGTSLEDFAEHRAKSELDALLEHAPQTARVIRKGKTLSVAVDEIKINDKIIINAGELVPVDSVIISGTANFDEASLTGESLPQSKDVNDKLLSGSINLDGSITARATETSENSQYQQIIKLVRGAASTQAPFVRLADRYALPFTIMAYALAATVWVISGQAIRFLEVIIVATPCPLLLAAPIAFISGMARSSRYGIIVKTGLALERMAEAKAIAFDKTGTLTQGVPSVNEVIKYGDYSEEQVLYYAASVEQGSSHILAQAIITDAKLKKLKLTKAKKVLEVPGKGLQAHLKGKDVLVGGLNLLLDNNVVLPAKLRKKQLEHTAAYVAIDGKLVGAITLIDDVRVESKDTLSRLRQLGIRKILMITGDNKATADLIAKQLGIDEVHAETLPADKLHVLSKIKTHPLIFVGDGVNDAPVLTASDVGIALGAKGSAAASESADVVIMLDDLSRVAIAIEIAKKTFAIARQSIMIGILLSLILMGVFATGKFPPLLGAALQEVVDVFVIFNALRAHIINPLTVSN
ncbi:MAG: heavy metal translocating P-type ATPase [Candidatus Saccharimonadales bacterium]